jgi:type I restriction enzyme S subunit
MDDWKTVPLGEVANVKGGKRLPAGTALTASRTSHPYLRIVDFKDGGVDRANLLYVPDDVFPKIKNYIVNSGDIYISIVGTIGMVGIIPRSLHLANLTENAAKICEFTGSVDARFLSFFLKSAEGQEQIRSLTVGSTQPKLALFRIKAIRVPLPTLPEQRAIAATLGALDDKIELNRRMNETLEAMARALFRDWFVDFGPTRAKMAGQAPYLSPTLWDLFPDSLDDEGKPEGWERVPASAVVDFNPTERLKKGAPAPYLEMSALPTTGPNADEPVLRDSASGSKFRVGDGLMARITPCLENGKTAFVHNLLGAEVGWGSTEFIVMRAKAPFPSCYSYILARDVNGGVKAGHWAAQK